MNIQLDPPSIPPMSDPQRSQLRDQVMEKTRPTNERTPRRWVAPALAVAAVAAVVAGTLVVAGKQSGDPAVAGAATQAGTVAATSVDLGPITRGSKADRDLNCRFPEEQGTVKQLWSRHVRGITKDTTALVGLAVDVKSRHPEDAKLGVRVCMTRTPRSVRLGSSGLVAVVADKAWTARPTTAQGLTKLATDSDLTAGNATLQTWSIYRARPEIARVEARYVWQGKTGEWTQGVVDGGYVYAEVQANGKFKNRDHLGQQIRAFDAKGKPVPVKL